MAQENLNMFTCDAGSFSISEAIAGQTPLIMYDALKQVALLPELRANTADGRASIIMPYAEKTPEALFSQMQAAWGSENRTRRSSEIYWLEYDSYDTLTFVVDKSNGAVPAGGDPVTVNFNSLSKSQNGSYVKPLSGYYAWVKENNRQLVIISAVNGSTSVQLTPVDGEVLNLTQYSRYTIVINPLRMVAKVENSDITTEGMILNPPTMYKSYAQKFEKAFSVHEDEITNYVYDRDFKIIKGLNTKGESVEYFYIPAMNGQMEGYIQDNKNLMTLFGRRDRENEKGFDGVVPSIEKFGMFNAGYDIFTNVSLKQILFGMIKTLRRINGCNQYMLANDFNFWMDWSDNIAELIRAAGQSVVYELFGSGGTGSRDFSYYDFKNWESFGYKFTPYMMDVFDARRYGNVLEYFSLMLPLTKFKDQFGATVPWITYCYVAGAEPAKVDNIWVDDARKRLGRHVRVACQTTYGMECHRVTAAGIIKRTPTS